MEIKLNLHADEFEDDRVSKTNIVGYNLDVAGQQLVVLAVPVPEGLHPEDALHQMHSLSKQWQDMKFMGNLVLIPVFGGERPELQIVGVVRPTVEDASVLLAMLSDEDRNKVFENFKKDPT